MIERVREGGARTGFHFDISALKREQATLRAAGEEALRSASHFRGIIEHAPSGMLVVDAAGRLVEANRAFRSALGEGADPVGRPLADLVAPEDAGVLAEMLAASAQAAGDRGPAVREMRFPRPNGGPIWARVSAVGLHLPQNPSRPCSRSRTSPPGARPSGASPTWRATMR